MNRLHTTLLITTALLLMTAVPALANPLDPVVTAGEVAIEGVGSATVTVNQTTDKAIIDWRSFDIGLGEGTTFVQPDAGSVVLNRVTGGEGASQILGTLTANGQVFLINPDGILIGKDAIIDVGALVASTHDIFDGDFLSGNYAFGLTGNADASIINLGTITVTDGGFAALVAPGVRNAGTITANLGKVSLASATSFSLDLYGDNLITLGLSDEVAGQIIDLGTGKPLDALVGNDGLLRADGGTVQLTAAATRAVIDSVVNNTGVIEANSVGLRDGKIVLSAATADAKPADAPSQKVKVSGTLSTSGTDWGETGGKIEITGEEIELLLATLDAAGLNGGGTVLVGGDVGGGDPNWNVVSTTEVKPEDHQVANATLVTVSAGTVIDASATGIGDGGKVIIWSDESTSFYGEIAARGGAEGGDGGFVETSGHQTLVFNGSVDTLAANGASGTLLLDPLNVTIGTTGANSITPSAIVAALATTNVKVTTGSTGTEAGDITVADGVSWSSANTLTLSAARNIAVNAAITNTGGADISLRADDQGTGVGTVAFGGLGSVTTTEEVGIYYNPVSYAAPEDSLFTPYVTAGDFSAYMLVSTIDDLQDVSTNLSGTYALGRNIDASATEGWNGGLGFLPIGYSSASTTNNGWTLPITGVNATPGQFVGTFDGLGHTISDLTINNASAHNLGLFGWVGASGTIRNVGLSNATVVAGADKHNVGLLVGVNYGAIEGAWSTGTLTIGNGTGRAGGLVGWNWNGTISASHSDANVEAGNGGEDIGGLVGNGGFAGSGTITDSFATGSMTVGNDTGGIGGLIGSNNGSKVFNSYATGAVTAGTNATNVGGLVGGSSGYWASSLVSGSYASGDVIAGVGSHSTGGLVGTDVYNSPISNSYALGDVVGDNNVGGLVGSVGASTVSLSYAVGEVTGTTYVGGIAGLSSGVISGSYWDTQSSGTGVGLGGSGGGSFSATGQTTAQLTAGLPVGFDPSIWGIDPGYNDEYPYLLWERAPVIGPTETVFTPDGVVPPPPPNPDPPNDVAGSRLFKFVPLANESESTAAEALEPLGYTPPAWLVREVEATYSAADISAITRNAIFALVANNSYHDLEFALPAGWSRLNNFSDRTSASGLSVEVVQRGNEIIVGFRGTASDLDRYISFVGLLPDLGQSKIPGVADVYKDAQFWAMKRLNDSWRLVQEIAQTYPNATITLTGHSLGGGIADYVAAQMGLHAVTFDAAPIGPILGTMGRSDLSGYADVVPFTGPGDPLSRAEEITGVSAMGPPPLVLTSAGRRRYAETLWASLDVSDYQGGSLSTYILSYAGEHLSDDIDDNHAMENMARAAMEVALVGSQGL